LQMAPVLELEQKLTLALILEQREEVNLEEVDFDQPRENLGSLIDELRDLVDEAYSNVHIAELPHKVPRSLILDVDSGLFYYTLIDEVSASFKHKNLYIKLNKSLTKRVAPILEEILDNTSMEILKKRNGEIIFTQGGRSSYKINSDDGEPAMRLFRNVLVMHFGDLIGENANMELFEERRDAFANIVTEIHKQQTFVHELQFSLNEYLFYLENKPELKHFIGYDAQVPTLVDTFLSFMQDQSMQPDMIVKTKTGLKYQVSHKYLNTNQFRYIIETKGDVDRGVVIGFKFPLDLENIKEAAMKPLEQITIQRSDGQAVYQDYREPLELFLVAANVYEQDPDKPHGHVKRIPIYDSLLLAATGHNVKLEVGEEERLRQEIIENGDLKMTNLTYTPILLDGKPIVQLGHADVMLYPKNYYQGAEYNVAMAVANSIYQNMYFLACVCRNHNDGFNAPSALIEPIKFMDKAITAEVNRRNNQLRKAVTEREKRMIIPLREEVLKELPLVIEQNGVVSFEKQFSVLIQQYLHYSSGRYTVED
ncbi:MAG: hypothetical protein KKG59_00025, partial [Nanoarchaeota archaeon]|nr:hypothetical protein [Nanoarchaeota archaeon]